MYSKKLQEIIRLIQPGKPIICFDYGARKIGVAATLPDHSFSMPKKVIVEGSSKKQLEICSKEVKEVGACLIIVGLPLNMDGSQSKQTVEVQKFALKLEEYSCVPVYLQDERLTSRAADNLLKGAGLGRKDRNSKDDAIAANLILETFLQLKNNSHR